MKEGYESYRVLAECDSSFLSASMTQWFHFFYNIGTFKHLLFNVETMSKQTDVIMQPTGKWIKRISQSKHVIKLIVVKQFNQLLLSTYKLKSSDKL